MSNVIPVSPPPLPLLLQAARFAMRRPEVGVQALRMECETSMGRAYQLVRCLAEWKVIGQGSNSGQTPWKTTIHPRYEPRVLSVIQQYQGRVPHPHPLDPIAIPGLSIPLRQLLDCAAEGLGDAEAASVLHVSPNTVKSQMRTLKTVLGASNRAHIVHLAHMHGLLPNPYNQSGKDSQ